MGQLAPPLQDYLSHPIVDESGLVGHYNFQGDWKELGIAELSASLERSLGIKAEKSWSFRLMDRVSLMSTCLPRGVRERGANMLAAH